MSAYIDNQTGQTIVDANDLNIFELYIYISKKSRIAYLPNTIQVGNCMNLLEIDSGKALVHISMSVDGRVL